MMFLKEVTTGRIIDHVAIDLQVRTFIAFPCVRYHSHLSLLSLDSYHVIS